MVWGTPNGIINEASRHSFISRKSKRHQRQISINKDLRYTEKVKLCLFMCHFKLRPIWSIIIWFFSYVIKGGLFRPNTRSEDLMVDMKRVSVHISQFRQNTPKLYQPKIVRGNEINSVHPLAINGLVFSK
jgi:hypothetical protein